MLTATISLSSGFAAAGALVGSYFGQPKLGAEIGGFVGGTIAYTITADSEPAFHPPSFEDQLKRMSVVFTGTVISGGLSLYLASGYGKECSHLSRNASCMALEGMSVVVLASGAYMAYQTALAVNQMLKSR